MEAAAASALEALDRLEAEVSWTLTVNLLPLAWGLKEEVVSFPSAAEVSLDYLSYQQEGKAWF